MGFQHFATNITYYRESIVIYNNTEYIFSPEDKEKESTIGEFNSSDWKTFSEKMITIGNGDQYSYEYLINFFINSVNKSIEVNGGNKRDWFTHDIIMGFYAPYFSDENGEIYDEVTPYILTSIILTKQESYGL